MTKNTLLNIAILVTRLLKGITISVAIVLTGLFLYVQINDEAFADHEIKLNQSQITFGYAKIGSSTFNSPDKDPSPYTVGNLKTISIYVFYFKGLLVMALFFMSIRAFEMIMLSVKTLKTFSSSNSKLFRKIGQYIIFITILTSYSVIRFESGVQTRLTVEFTPLIYALLSFIMAEIFKEGQSLREENDLTI